MTFTTTVPYEDYKKLVEDAADKENVVALLNTEFKDAECQLLAIKAVLGMEIKEEEPTDPTDPSDPGTTP